LSIKDGVERNGIVRDENKTGRFGRRPRINSYSFSAQVLLTVKNCRYLFRSACGQWKVLVISRRRTMPP